jgi:acetyl/propionyl-CoA carboxylase alpha subunit
VEHPVTEMVTDSDLVRLQIEVAQGDKIHLKQTDIKQRGHAIECRIYAEDPDQNFMPSIGTISKIGYPSLRNTRLDCGFKEGNVVGVNYDPMLAKFIVWGLDRSTAIQKSLLGLDEVPFLGVKTNRDYLKRILGNKEFIAGKTHTHFIPDHAEDLKTKVLDKKAKAKILAAFILGEQKMARGKSNSLRSNPWNELSGFRN